MEPCDLVVYEQNCVLGAQPAGKICFNDSYSILEVKYSKNTKRRPKRFLCYIQNSMHQIVQNSNKITFCKTPTYYDQIQMQLALTSYSMQTKKWLLVK